MNTFRRFLFLALFGTCGAAVAIGLAVSSDPTAKNPIKLPVADLPPEQNSAPQAFSHNSPRETVASTAKQSRTEVAPTAVESGVVEITKDTAPAAEVVEDRATEDAESCAAELVDIRTAEIVEDRPADLDIVPQPATAPADPRPESVTVGAYPAEVTFNDITSQGDDADQALDARNPLRAEPPPTEPRLAEALPPFAQQATSAQPPAPAEPSEPTVPVSTMMQVLDKIFDRDHLRQQPPAAESQVAQTQPQPPAQPQPQPQPPAQPQPQPQTTSELPPPPSGPKLVNENGDLLTINTKDTDIREVLDLISQGTGMNILATKNVSGTVTASLHNVTAETALASILRSTGYTAHREGNITYVGTADEFKTAAPPVAKARVLTRVYQPNYITAAEFQKLITSLLTPEVGTVSVTTPAENGIQSDSASAGGDKYANPEIVLVRDYEPVLFEIDQVFHEVDKRPVQVAIEAMILSVKIDDTNKLGVNFDLLRDHIRVISGSPPADIAKVAADGGLKVGFMDSSLTAFLEALETVGDTNVIATPRLTVLNKQRAEILIGSELGYVSSTVTETALTQSVEFLEVGTSLRIRPFVSSDGQIRMEVHPELSTGSVRVEEGFTLPDKETTQVTTNIIAKDGSTIIIGGLIREDLISNSTQIPFFGSLPVVGPAFRQKSEDLDRREIIVLITPRIMYDHESAREGDLGAMEFHHRQAVAVKKNLSPLSTRRLSLGHLHLAQQLWAQGDGKAALRNVNLAIHYDPQSRAAIDLRADIVNGSAVGDHTGQAPFIPLPNTGQPLDGAEVAPWVLDGLEAEAMPPAPRLHPWDPGRPGPSGDLMQQQLPPQNGQQTPAGPRPPATSAPPARASDREEG